MTEGTDRTLKFLQSQMDVGTGGCFRNALVRSIRLIDELDYMSIRHMLSLAALLAPEGRLLAQRHSTRH